MNVKKKSNVFGMFLSQNKNSQMLIMIKKINENTNTETNNKQK